MLICVFITSLCVLILLSDIFQTKSSIRQQIGEVTTREPYVIVSPRFSQARNLETSLNELNDLKTRLGLLMDVRGSYSILQFLKLTKGNQSWYASTLSPGALQVIGIINDTAESGTLENQEVVLGSDVDRAMIAPFLEDNLLEVKLHLAKTATSLDRSIFINEETARILLITFCNSPRFDSCASINQPMVFVAISPLANPVLVTNRILLDVANVSVFDPASFFKTTTSTLNTIDAGFKWLTPVVLAIAIIGLGLLVMILSLSERREVFVLRSVGIRPNIILITKLCKVLFLSLTGYGLALIVMWLVAGVLNRIRLLEDSVPTLASMIIGFIVMSAVVTAANLLITRNLLKTEPVLLIKE